MLFSVPLFTVFVKFLCFSVLFQLDPLLITMSDDEREEKELDLTSPEVVTKYKSAAEIVNS